MIVQALLDALMKWALAVRDKASACEAWAVELGRQTGSHYKELQVLRDKVLDLESRSRKYSTCIVGVLEVSKNGSPMKFVKKLLVRALLHIAL